MRTSLLLLAAFSVTACNETVPLTDKEPGLTDSGGIVDSGGSETIPLDDTGTTSAEDGTATLIGTIAVQLYTADSSGETSMLAWEDYGTTFPFGSIFVAAYSVDDTTNAITYYDDYVIVSPSPEGDRYALTVDTDDAASVHVFAVLDRGGDGILGTSEPTGLYPDAIALVADTTTSDVDITIQARVTLGGGGGDGDGSGLDGVDDTGGGGGGTVDPGVVLSGDVAITQPFSGGDGLVMLFDSAGGGPDYARAFTPVNNGAGADAAYTLTVATNYGVGRLLGAWDSNLNGLIDPSDAWGAYAIAGASGNPITVGVVSQSGLAIDIPFGTPPALTPFVRVEGNVTYAESFSTLPAGAVVYVSTLRTRPTNEFSFADLENGFDWASFTEAELTGTSLPYVLVTPANSVAYLWAYADMDGDGVLNEVGEPVAGYGRSGRIELGTSNVEVDIVMQGVVQ